MSGYTDRFGGIGRLVGEQNLDVLQKAHVCVIGIGGVGSWAVEALARSGIGALTLIDLDDICTTNINRQVHAIDGNVGRLKVEVMAERIALINPDCQVTPRIEFFSEKTADAILDTGFDYIIDAIDTSKQKCRLIKGCYERKQPLVTMGGAGGRTDGSKVDVADLNATYNDMLLYRIRKELRASFGFPRGDKLWGIPCVYSREKPVYPTADGDVCETPSKGTSLRMDCASGYGAATFVTGTFGFVAASVVVRALSQIND